VNPLARLATVAAVGILALAGCGEKRETGTGAGSTSTTPSTTPSGPAAATVNVKETEFKLDPSSPKVAKAGVVEFKVSNAGSTEHALEVEGPSGEQRTQPIEPGKSTSLKVDLSKPGTYEWYCPIDGHKDQGMKGEITVAGGGSGTTTTPEDSGGGNSGGGGGSGGY